MKKHRRGKVATPEDIKANKQRVADEVRLLEATDRGRAFADVVSIDEQLYRLLGSFEQLEDDSRCAGRGRLVNVKSLTRSVKSLRRDFEAAISPLYDRKLSSNLPKKRLKRKR